MADRRKGLPENVPGDFYVDSTCINCDTCRQLAPETFADTGDYSFVRLQPRNPDERREAFRALLACPTASIGSARPGEAKAVVADFPLRVAQEVFYCGFNSAKSYGANSYFVRHGRGNWLIDSPRYVEALAVRLERMGGVRFIFLTHRDDVADADKYARRFGSERIIHRLELAAQPDAERVIEGFDPVRLSRDFLAIPTPGHTRGHCVLLYRSRFLFTGDHLWWSRPRRSLHASREVCWHSWAQQTRSMERLLEHDFQWVLPGHGQRIRLRSPETRPQLEALVSRMTAAA